MDESILCHNVLKTVRTKLYKRGLYKKKGLSSIKAIYYLLIETNKENWTGSNKIYYFLYQGKKEEGCRLSTIENCLFVLGIK